MIFLTPLVRRPGTVASIGAVLLLGACTDAPTSPTSAPSRSISAASASFSQSPELNGPGNAHIMHTVPWFANDHAQDAKSGGGGASAPIVYHGGPVLQAGTNVAAVYWANAPIYANAPAVGTTGAGSKDASLVGYFLNHLGGSPYFNINSSYTDGSGKHIVNSVAYTQYWANGTNAPSGSQTVSDAQMVAMLQSGFDSGKLTYNASTLYAIFTAGKVNLGGGFGTQYCAYHSWGSVTVNGQTKTVLYAAMPYDYAYPSGCTSSQKPANGSADPGADYEVNTLAHETEETTTDLLGNAWYDRRGYENADKCAWTWGTTYTNASGGVANMKIGGLDFLVQRNWVAGGSCALSY